MDSGPQSCRTVIADIASALGENHLANLSATVYQHLSICSRCRAGLLVLVRGFDPEPERLGTSRACGPCQTDLAAFIDLEVDDPVLAATTYPHVWWHLWICRSCSQTYDLTHSLLGAQQAGAIPSLHLLLGASRHTVPVAQRVSLSRQRIMLTLPVREPAFAVWRGGGESYVLYDETDDEPERRQFTIIIQEQNDDSWDMIANVIPPPEGLLVLTVGTSRSAAPFGLDGKATISGIPADVFTDPDAPNLEVSIVPSEQEI